MIQKWRGQRLISSRFKVQQIRSAKSLIDLLLASVTKRSSNQSYSSTDWGRVDKKKEIPRVGGSACVVGGGGSSSLVSELRSAGWAWQQLAHLSTTFTNTTWLNRRNPNVIKFYINRKTIGFSFRKTETTLMTIYSCGIKFHVYTTVLCLESNLPWYVMKTDRDVTSC